MPGLCGGYNPFGAKNGRETETLGVLDEPIHHAAMILVDANVDMCQGLNSHFFHIIGDGHQPNSRGLYAHIRIPFFWWDDHPQYKEFRPWHICCCFDVNLEYQNQHVLLHIHIPFAFISIVSFFIFTYKFGFNLFYMYR